MAIKRKRFSVFGQRWRDTYGNTYHRVLVIDYIKEKQYRSNIQYGYGDQYRQTAQQLLKHNGYRTTLTPSNTVFTVADVSRKRDL